MLQEVGQSKLDQMFQFYFLNNISWDVGFTLSFTWVCVWRGVGGGALNYSHSRGTKLNSVQPDIQAHTVKLEV